jgi:rare lipoprotein A
MVDFDFNTIIVDSLDYLIATPQNPLSYWMVQIPGLNLYQQSDMFNKIEVLLRSLEKIFFVLILVALVGFTVIVNEDTSSEPVVTENLSSVNKAEISADRTLVEFVDKGNMKASWYGPGFHGRVTANGEVYDQMSFTAAHKSLKFGTLLKITNPRNNKSVVIRINDRGPYVTGRDLDLSKAAALELGMVKRGVVKMKVEEIKIAGLDNPNLN